MLVFLKILSQKSHALSLPLLSCKSWMFMEENPDRKKNSSDCFSFILVSIENIFREKPWKSKTQVTSCELLVQIYGLRVRIYEWRVQILELRVQIQELRVQNTQVMSLNPRVRTLKARVATFEARVGRFKKRVRRLKAWVEAIKPRFKQ